MNNDTTEYRIYRVIDPIGQSRHEEYIYVAQPTLEQAMNAVLDIARQDFEDAMQTIAQRAIDKENLRNWSSIITLQWKQAPTLDRWEGVIVIPGTLAPSMGVTMWVIQKAARNE